MNPNTFLLKILAEAICAATPQGSVPNAIASVVKTGTVLNDIASANSKEQAAHALASLLSEYVYSNSPSEREKVALTIGKALLMAAEAAQYAQTTPQNIKQNIAVPAHTSSQNLPTYNLQQSPYFQHESKVFQNEFNKRIEQLKQLQRERDQLKNELDRQERELQQLQDEQKKAWESLQQRLNKR